MTTRLLKGLAALFSLLPLSVALAIGRGLGWILGSVVRHRRSDVIEAISRSFPEKSEREVLQVVNGMYRHLGMNGVEFMRLLGGRSDQIDQLVTVSGEEHVREALSRGKGVLALVSHVGNWEYLALSIARLFHPTGIIIKDIKKSDLNDYLVESREAQGIKIFLRRGAYRACVRALRENMLIGFVLDQNMRATEGAFVDFFGRPACTTLGLAHMAARSQCPIVPIFIERKPGGRHEVTVQPLLEPPGSRDLEELEAATALYTSIIEEAVRKHPEQWTWIHRRWRTKRPETVAVEEEAGSAPVAG